MVLKRVGVVSCAKITGTLYGILGILIGSVFALFWTLGLALGRSSSGQVPFAAMFGVGAIVVAPILYGVLGFIGGLISAGLYNWLAGFVGGIEVELQ